MSVAVVVVTYNRRALLERCLFGLAHQTHQPDCVFVVDNASTDGTRDWLSTWLTTHLPQAEVAAMQQNVGGAGGFAKGLQKAVEAGADWIWMMDDDAEPHLDALAELTRVATNPDNIYGSLATSGNETSWLTTLVDSPRRVVSRMEEVPTEAKVQTLPFLGILVHRSLVEKIGLPNAGFFIAADDVEYCIRAQRLAGADIIIAGRSRIEHPKSRPYEVKLPFYTLTALALPPWKRYYDTRNRLLIARKYYGYRLFTQTIPGSFVRLFAALSTEPRKLVQLKAWCCGMFDGLLGIKGKRHGKWGIE